ncbi:MAG: hypothetical protein U0935_00620 [Pirellulales bacterium]
MKFAATLENGWNSCPRTASACTITPIDRPAVRLDAHAVKPGFLLDVDLPQRSRMAVSTAGTGRRGYTRPLSTQVADLTRNSSSNNYRRIGRSYGFVRGSDLSAAFLRWRRQDYYDADESEWATDDVSLVPATGGDLPALVQHALSVFGETSCGSSAHPTDGDGGRFAGEASGDLRFRPKVLKHRSRNSLKMYDKQGSVLRIETTINDGRLPRLSHQGR